MLYRECLILVMKEMVPVSGDSVVCQNFLMKRSQVTRIFRRRFTILTANGKLYSFRKVDLSRPETFQLAQASLVWDIRGCSVELGSGKHSWVLRPTGPNLKEEIHLRTCSALPSHSAHHWMRIMLAVARNNLGALYHNDLSVLKINFELLVPGVALFVESEGCMHPMAETPEGYAANLVIRDNDPGACIIIRRFGSENGGETGLSQSDLIPRYRFHKSNTTLPWTRCKSQLIALYVDTTLQLSGNATMVINEGLRDYAVPIYSRPLAVDPSFDLAAFKFQIKRLIRLIDRIGGFKDAIVDVFEWKETFSSSCWLIYLSIVLLFFPAFIPSCILAHLTWYSLLHSQEFRHWWKQSIGFVLINNVRSICGAKPIQGSSKGVSETVLSPVHRTVPVVSSPTHGFSSSSASPAMQQTKDRIKAAMKEVVQTVSKSLTTAQPKEGGLKTEIWENQRRVIGGTQFHASNLSIFDRSRWSDSTGTIPLEAPSSREWKIDVEPKTTDENGWMYSFRWNSLDFHPTFGTFDFVRRRRWTPLESTLSPPTSVASLPAAVQLPPFELGSETPQFEMNIVEEPIDASPIVSSLTNMVTSGPEYGNIQDDYDEVNSESQPKQLAGITSIFQEFKSTANRAQFEIANICEEIERYFALLSWRDELVSTVATTVLVIIIVALVFVPMNFIVYLIVLSHFNLGYRRNKWRNIAVKCVLKQHVEPLLQDRSVNALGGLEAHKLCLALSRSTGTNVSQKVLANLNSGEDLAIWICRQNPAFSQVRKWMKRDWVENFLGHVPPDVCDEQQVFFADANEYRPLQPVISPVIGSMTPPEFNKTDDNLSVGSGSHISETL